MLLNEIFVEFFKNQLTKYFFSLSEKMHNEFLRFLLVFEIWLILYATLVNSELGNLICEPYSETITSDTRESVG